MKYYIRVDLEFEAKENYNGFMENVVQRIRNEVLEGRVISHRDAINIRHLDNLETCMDLSPRHQMGQ